MLLKEPNSPIRSSAWVNLNCNFLLPKVQHYFMKLQRNLIVVEMFLWGADLCLNRLEPVFNDSM